MDTYSRKELVEKYLRAAWILKIRLMSARRHLWANDASLIHIETACLQIRKACETIAYLCVIAAEIEFDEPLNLRTNYKVGEVFKRLTRSSKLLFPAYARLAAKDALNEQTIWELDIKQTREEDIDRVKRIHDRTGHVMHEFSPYRNFPASNAVSGALSHDLNAIRADHQWLWNQFWHHANRLKGTLFFIDLDDMTEATQPMIIKVEGFLDETIEVDFDPNYVCDFTAKIDWNEFQ
ncbi:MULTISPECIES: hypothetical protein [unclassified Mesorhizobium]|uniref:hypothetical protein n=1 Tax=unclassified Mesorhizobium TaxID=325217 RepID=UPI00112DD5FD|nr:MULTISPECIES: hypothetical protein [unclassified Mesorhizobium]MBZ9701484.1 hypothetical protein [Mesorhizobium sp. CO1-1-3]MBZ9948042.1 hypothetical protein [Mesorhizobium sp. BR1-1-11]TPJ03003.1 hypothetical protein FJ428_17330 [Mesorhizobium sp. B2-8-1]